MAECECLKECPFFNDLMTHYPVTVEMMKEGYCLGYHRDCARFMIFKALGGDKVPANLFPNDTELANKLLTHT